jgi:hypothetical protein
MAFIRRLDLVLLVVALPIFIVAGLPLAGYAAGAGAWLAQRGLQAYTDRRARASDDPRTVVGLLAGSMIARAWLVAIVIFLVGLSDNQAGLAAAVLVIALFTVYFTIGMIMRPFDADAEAGDRGPRTPGGRPPRAPGGPPPSAPLQPNGGAR